MEDDFNKTLDLFQNIMKDEKAAETIKMLVNLLNAKNETEPELPKNNNMYENTYENHSKPVKVMTDEQESETDKKINTIIKIKKVYDQISRTEDPLINLLKALKPYLSPKRLSTVDSAIKMVHLSKLSTIINEFDL